MPKLLEIPSNQLSVVSWTDEKLDRTGHDPRGRYVEKYWLGILGPSSTWLLRYLVDELEASPNGFVMDVAATAQSLGIPRTSKWGPFNKSITRLTQFGLARMGPSQVLAVRRRIPSLHRGQIGRLNDHLRAQHEYWEKKTSVGT